MLRWGPDKGSMVVVALPLLEEANRVRAFAVSICRALAERGVASVLPDLPGTGESLADSATLHLKNLREAFSAAVEQASGGRRVYGGAIRSGALLDGDAPLASRWRFAAQDGSRLLRESQRIVDAAARGADTAAPRLESISSGEKIDVAGHQLSGLLLIELSGAVPADVPRRDVRLEGDSGPADMRIAGAPLWRRAEPGNDFGLAQILADDIAQWMRACEGY